MVHQVLMFDADGRRTTQLISNVWVIDRMYATIECVDDGTGRALLSIRYSFEPGAPLDPTTRDVAAEVVREHTEGDFAGVKRRAEEVAGSAT